MSDDAAERGTPGPWFWNSYSGIWSFHISKGHPGNSSDEDEPPMVQVASVCDFVEHGGDELFSKEAQANARLIAQAPELRDTLAAAEAKLEDVQSHYEAAMANWKESLDQLAAAEAKIAALREAVRVILPRVKYLHKSLAALIGEGK